MHVLFVGGGTLGSVTPLLAMIEELRDRVRVVRCSWWGTRAGPERALVEAAGISFASLPSGKFRRYWDLQHCVDPFRILGAGMIALVRMVRDRPDVVVGAGAFVQVPVMWAAWLLQVPVMIHQLDVRPGLANRLVAPTARMITGTFSSHVVAFGARSVVRIVGNPVRRALGSVGALAPGAAKQFLGFPPHLPLVLVLGGGTGAHALNVLAHAARGSLKQVSVLVVTGQGKGVGTDTSFSPRSSSGGVVTYREVEFLDMETLVVAYAAADVVVSRAGMGTVTELGVLGKVTVLVPIPESHQEENAAAIAMRGAAVVWPQRELTPEEFARRLRALLADEAQCMALAQAARDLFPVNAAARSADIILQVIHASETTNDPHV
ncbi:glycosyltransferase [Candidatus Uhrbacteria bacterium]|nr:glycosyltransferase [Candidatus Uhrbacteria bacterium]